jgi:hypothetical protein
MAKQSAKNQSTAQQAGPEHNPALDDIQVLIGEWDMTLFQTAFLPSPSDSVTGRASFRWVEEGGYVEMRQIAQDSGAPWAIWLIGRDESTGRYEVLYFDGRGSSRIYEMSFAEGTWRLWRDAPGFLQRFEGKVNEAGDTIEGQWENSSDGRDWALDFKMTYSRIT